MTDHPENTPINRFFALTWALAAVLVFGFVAFLIAGGQDEEKNEFDEARVAERVAKLEEVRAAQAKLLSGNGEAVEGSEGLIRIPIDVAAELVAAEAAKSVPRVTGVPVPGTPAALALMQQAAEAEAANAPAEEKEKAAPEKEEKTEKAGEAGKPKAAPAPKAAPKKKADEAAPKAAPKKKAEEAAAPAKEAAKKAGEKKAGGKAGGNKGKGKAKAKGKAGAPKAE